jgi:hypothetical protein
MCEVPGVTQWLEARGFGGFFLSSCHLLIFNLYFFFLYFLLTS